MGGVDGWRGVVRGVSAGWLLAGAVACASVSGPERCAATGVSFPGSVCLEFEPAAETAAYRGVIEDEVARTLGAMESVLPVREVRILIAPDRGGIIREIGIGGRALGEDEVHVFVDSRRPDIKEILRRELFPMLAHELHHAVRAGSVGYGSTVLEAAISEGLADHFSVEIAGVAPPPWSRALEGETLERELTRLLAHGAGPYDHAEWFFGTGERPRWTGYAVGFELVGRYLDRNPGARASSLVDERAGSILGGAL